MKRISAIEFVNYKAFYLSGDENKIVIPNGKSVLIYGENGSGKSSIYEGLNNFSTVQCHHNYNSGKTY